MDICTGNGVTIINSVVKGQYLSAGLVTVDAFTHSPATVSHVPLGLKITVELPSSLARQPYMTSLPNQTLKIIN